MQLISLKAKDIPALNVIGPDRNPVCELPVSNFLYCPVSIFE